MVGSATCSNRSRADIELSRNCIQHGCQCDYQDSISRPPRAGEAIVDKQENIVSPDASQANIGPPDSGRDVLALESTLLVQMTTEVERPDSMRLNTGNFPSQSGRTEYTANQEGYSAEYLENGHVRLKWRCVRRLLPIFTFAQ